MSVFINLINNYQSILDVVTPFGQNDSAAGILWDVWRTFCFAICDTIYPLIGFFYKFFLQMSTINFLEKIDIVNGIYKRITMLLGLIMLFVSIFYLIQLLLNPDKTNDKEFGVASLLKRMVVVIVLIGFVPKIFDIAFDIQEAIVEENIIGKIILGDAFVSNDKANSSTNTMTLWGYQLESNLFSTFYYPNPILDDEDEVDQCVEYELILAQIAQDGEMTLAGDCLTYRSKSTATYNVNSTSTSAQQVYIYSYSTLLSVVIGVVILWMLIVYSLNVGTRVIQLAYLQIIAPIPIISYLVPKKDGMLSKWIKQATTTYIDLFIRVAIIYFVMYIVHELYNLDIGGQIGDSSLIPLVKIVLILGLFLFARRAPQLIQELTGKPSAASLGFGLGGTNAAAGLLMGSATLAATNFVGSTGAARFTGLARGLVRGAAAGTAEGNYRQNMDRAHQREENNNRMDEWLKLQGYRGLDRHRQRLIMAAGGVTQGERFDALNQEYQAFDEALGKNKTVKAARTINDAFKTGGMASAIQAARESGLDFENITSTITNSKGEEETINTGVRIFNENGGLLATLDENSTAATLAQLVDDADRFAIETPGVHNERDFRTHERRLNSLEGRLGLRRTLYGGPNGVGSWDTYDHNKKYGRRRSNISPSPYGSRGGPRWGMH